MVKHINEEMEFGETKNLRQYSNKQNILFVGEGDFSFSLSLARAFGSATNITATSLDTREEIRRKYTNGIANVEALERFGCTVLHGVDAPTMASDSRLEFYDRIVFNFPHSGTGFGRDEHKCVFVNSLLVKGFMESARKMLKDEDGEIHITHKTTSPYNSWSIETLGENIGLRLIGVIGFNQYSYPGYSNKKGDGSNSSFYIGQAATYKFKYIKLFDC